MTPYLATVGILALAFFALFLAENTYRRRERAFDRREAAWEVERRQLLNRLMYSQGRPWEGPPEMPMEPEEFVLPDIIDPLQEAI